MTTTTTTERHPAIASPELDAALERLAFVEATAAADVARVATATANAAIKMLMDVRIKNPPILIRFPRGPFRERERSNA